MDINHKDNFEFYKNIKEKFYKLMENETRDIQKIDCKDDQIILIQLIHHAATSFYADIICWCFDISSASYEEIKKYSLEMLEEQLANNLLRLKEKNNNG